jgi:hypothetical protein
LFRSCDLHDADRDASVMEDSTGPNGEPGSNPVGAGAVTCLRQQGQTPLWRLMRVTVGLMVGNSM